MSERAMRNNKGKIPYELLPLWVLKGVAKRYKAGLRVYAPWNWTKGQPVSELLGSLLRHIAAFQDGETIDPDPRMDDTTHLDAAICNLISIIETLETKPEFDDRPKRYGCAVHAEPVEYSREIPNKNLADRWSRRSGTSDKRRD